MQNLWFMKKVICSEFAEKLIEATENFAKWEKVKAFRL